MDSEWRRVNGYRLAIIGYYSKTLDPAQKNYPIYDKEAGAMLLCVRHWSDLISYHPTTVYTDSSVAASMLTKHAAPPRLQRQHIAQQHRTIVPSPLQHAALQTDEAGHSHPPR